MTDEQRDGAATEVAGGVAEATAVTAPGEEQRSRPRRGRSPAKKQLFIHAGIHRTGTTAVQEALAGCRKDLADHGVSYPVDFTSAGSKQERHLRSVNHLNLAFALQRKEISAEDLLEWFATVAAGCWKVVLSAEDFCRLDDLQFLEPLRDVFDVQAIFYLRRQDDWVNSWYNQNIRWPFDRTLAKTTPLGFLDHLDSFSWLRYYDLLERWERALGRENLRVRVAERGQVSDVIADLFDICGLEQPPKLHRANESAPASQLELLRRLELIDQPNNARMVVLNALAHLPLASSSTNVYTAAVRKLILQRYLMQNEKVARVYLDRPDGILFQETGFPNDVPVIDGPLDEEMLLAFVGRLVEMASSKPSK